MSSKMNKEMENKAYEVLKDKKRIGELADTMLKARDDYYNKSRGRFPLTLEQMRLVVKDGRFTHRLREIEKADRTEDVLYDKHGTEGYWYIFDFTDEMDYELADIIEASISVGDSDWKKVLTQYERVTKEKEESQ